MSSMKHLDKSASVLQDHLHTISQLKTIKSTTLDYTPTRLTKKGMDTTCFTWKLSSFSCYETTPYFDVRPFEFYNEKFKFKISTF